MPRPHLVMSHYGYCPPTAKLDPRFHPLGQPGPKIPWVNAILRIPYGLRIPAFVLTYCFLCWNGRHWLYPYGPRTTANVRIPIHDDWHVDAIWEDRFRKQFDIFRFGHIYYLMQEERLKKAREDGLIE